MRTDEIRRRFLDYFQKHGHALVQSDSLVPSNDPSLLFTGAGMNQFKDLFLGAGKMEYTRATSCQKCLRTGDIQNVGKTAAHHTFFEMLGNFSFGDYFKRETILWAWDFLLNELKVDPHRLSVTVFTDDEEAYSVWADEVKIPPEKIYRFSAKSNYWPANAVEDGPNGPCGPCSEIFFDQGAGVGCRRKKCDPSCDCDRFVEIWNLVFTQFERCDGGTLKDLPQKNIDTGMGLERIAAVMQGKLTNFEIDIFLPVVKEAARLTGVDYTAAAADSRLRRIADHVRAICFLIVDGVLPANEGRGYVLRRLLRRAVSDGVALGAQNAFAYELVPVIAEVMKAPYPDLAAKRENLARIIKAEEERFLETLASGAEMLQRLFDAMKADGRAVVSGPDAFRLYDTFGYPVEFLSEKAAALGFDVDVAAFENEMDAQRERARSGSKMTDDIFAAVRGPVHDLAARLPSTVFRGYDHQRLETKVIGLLKGDSLADSLDEGSQAALVLAETPFYAESGGQVADSGVIRGDGFLFEVRDTKNREGLFLHIGSLTHGSLAVGSDAVAEIDLPRRLDVMRNHTATHLLQFALRKRLGDHVEQAGSLVSPDRLRFDFTHFHALRKEELRDVERIVNGVIAENLPVSTRHSTLDEARSEGVIALFGEKYGQTVRVVRVGDISAELCGGTHLGRSGSIGLLKILSEESVAAGVRRITAVTASAALDEVHRLESVIEDASAALDVPPSRLVERAGEIVSEAKSLRKEMQKSAASKAASAAGDFLADAADLGSLRLIVKRIDGLAPDDLRLCIDSVKTEKSLVAVLGSVKDGRPFLIGSVSADLLDKGFSAADIVRSAAREIKGGGGGRPDMAQAGGKDPSGLDHALEKAAEAVKTAI